MPAIDSNIVVPMNSDNFIDVTLFDRCVTTLIDTGSTACLMDYRLFQRFPQLISRLQPYTNNLVAANSQELSVLGVIQFYIKIGNRPFPLRALVCKDLCYSLLLGSDFLRRSRSVLNIHQQTISFSKPKQSVLAASITVPPRTEIVCNVKILGRAMNCLPGLLEPNKSLLHSGVAVSRVLTNRRGKLAPVKLLNFTDSPVTVPRGSLLGKFHTLPPLPACAAVNKSPLSDPVRRNKHVVEILSKINLSQSTLTTAEKSELVAIITEFADVFASSHIPMGKCDLVKHTIELQDGAQLPRCRPYRLSPPMKLELEKHIKAMLAQDLIEPSQAPCSSPVLLIKKPNGTTRMVTDFRKLNKVIKDCPEPLPTIQEIFDHLSVTSDNPTPNLILSTMDLDQGYHQLVLDKNSRAFTTFTTPMGQYNYKRLGMGLRTAPWMFLRTINRVLHSGSESSWRYLMCYVDDLLCYSPSVPAHFKHLRLIFSKFRQANLQLNPAKCNFGCEKLSFLGMTLSSAGISPDPDKVRAIAEYPRPKNVKELRSFLGASSWFRRFIKGYGAIAAPLYRLLRKETPYTWTPDHQQAFERIRSALTSDQVLAFPDWSQPFHVFSDASGEAIGGLLCQKHPTLGFRPIGYCGRAMTAPEKQLSVSHQECLAAVYTIKQFISYLTYSTFILHTDHMALRYLLTSVEPRGQFGRWVAFLSTLNYTVQHRPAKDMAFPDFLSRREYPPTTHFDTTISDPPALPSFPFGINQATQTESAEPSPANDGFTVHTDPATTPKSLITDAHPTLTDPPADTSRSPINDQVLSVIDSPSDDSTINNDLSAIDTSLPSTDTVATVTSPELTCAARTARGLLAYKKLHNVIDFPVSPYPLKDITRETFIAEQKSDPYLHTIRAFLEHDIYPDDHTIARKLLIDQAHFFIADHMLYHVQLLPRKSSEPQQHTIQMCVPQSLIVPVLQAHHDDIYHGGHLGIYKTMEKLRRKYWWPKFQHSIVNFIKTCDICLQNKIPRTGHRAQILHLPRANTPTCHLCIDFVSVCTSEPDQYKYLLTAVCLHSRYLWAFPCKDQTAETVASVLNDQLFLKYGLPDIIHSDNASNFTSQLVTTLYQIYGIRASYTCPYRAQSNSVLERKHATLKSVLRSYVHDQSDQWPKFLNAALFAVNNSEQESALGHTPNFLLFGVNLRSPLDSRLEIPVDTPAPIKEHLSALLTGLENARRVVSQCLDKAEARTEKLFARYPVSDIPTVGALCYIYRPALDKSGSKALRFNYIGPYYICEKVSDTVFRLRLMSSNRLLRNPIHLNHLKIVSLRRHRPADMDTPDHLPADIDPPQLDQNEIPPEDLIDVTNTEDVDIDIENGDDIEVTNPPLPPPQPPAPNTHTDRVPLPATPEPFIPRAGIPKFLVPDKVPNKVINTPITGPPQPTQTDLVRANDPDHTAPLPVPDKDVLPVPPPRRSKRLAAKAKVLYHEIDDSPKPPPPVPSEYYSITKILQGRYKDNHLEYLVQWSDLTQTWVKFSDLNARAKAYIRQHPIPFPGPSDL